MRTENETPAVPAAKERGNAIVNKVLVIDDSTFLRQHVRRVLQDASFDVVEASDGDAALAMLSGDEQIGLVLCDINMPKRSGIEVLEALGARLQHLPVVMLTTEGAPELIQRAKALGARGWMVKPFKPDMLVATARKLIGGAPEWHDAKVVT
jgi:two-component system, chemotaxis family, chemotaxis protein CheY